MRVFCRAMARWKGLAEIGRLPCPDGPGTPHSPHTKPANFPSGDDDAGHRHRHPRERSKENKIQEASQRTNRLRMNRAAQGEHNGVILVPLGTLLPNFLLLIQLGPSPSPHASQVASV